MFAAETAPYLDVFMETDNTNTSILTKNIQVSILVLFISMALDSSKTLSTVITSLAVIGCLGAPIVGIIETNNQVGIQNQVIANMKHNVKEKYGQELVLDRSDLPKPENREKANRYAIIFRSEQHKDNYVRNEYLISFDRETNEPTLSELEVVEVPTAKEIVESAKK